MSHSARIALLDVQVVDSEGLPIGRVDDLEIELTAGPPRVTEILIGSEALGERIGGSAGRAIAAVSSRLRGPGTAAGPPRLPVEWIEELEPLIRLERTIAEMPAVALLEHWLARHFVERLPWSGHESE